MDDLHQDTKTNEGIGDHSDLVGGGITRREFLQLGSIASGWAAVTLLSNSTLSSLARALWTSWDTDSPDDVDMSNAVNVFVGDDIQQAVNANPENTIFRLKGVDRSGKRGIHRLQQVVPKNGQQFVGERGQNNERITVMSGAAILQANKWVLDGNYYRYDDAPLQPGRRVIAGEGEVSDGSSKVRAACTRPEDLFITTNGQCNFLSRVKTKQEVKKGESWFFDEDRKVELIQPWNNNGNLSILVYDWRDGQMVRKGGSHTGKSAKALAWLMADVDADGKNEMLQPIKNPTHGRLGLRLYRWQDGQMKLNWYNDDMNEGAEALAWLVGDIDGDGKVELLQPWHNADNQRLALLFYGWKDGQMKKRWWTDSMGEGPGALAWLMADIDDDGKDELLQVWDNGGRPELLVYSWQNEAIKKKWSGNIGAITQGTLRWLVADVDGDGKVELLQLLNNFGRLAVIIHGWSKDPATGNWGMLRKWATGDLGSVANTLDWLVADVDGDGKVELIQPFKNQSNGRLGCRVFEWDKDAMKIQFESLDTGEGADALAWLVADVDDDGQVELLQPWRNPDNKRLALRVYGWKDEQMKKIWSSDNMGEGAGALTWLAANIDTGPRKIYIHKDDNPTLPGRTIELSLMKFAFGYNVERPGRYLPDWPLGKDPRKKGDHPNINDPTDQYISKPAKVAIRGIIIEKYACPAQSGAIGYFRPGNDWTILSNEVRYCHGSGIQFKGRAVVRANYIHHNGQFGLTAGDGNRSSRNGGGREVGLEEWGFNGGYAGSGAVVEGNLVEANNHLAFNAAWGAGGSKFSQCYDLILRNNIVLDNKGPGLWSDFSYTGLVYEGNLLLNNTGPGINHEVSLEAKIRNNILIGNSTIGLSGHASQLFLVSSSTVLVEGNCLTFPRQMTGYRHGIMVVQWAYNSEPYRSIEEFPVYCQNITIKENTIISEDSGSGDNGGMANHFCDNTIHPITGELIPGFYDSAIISFNKNGYHYPEDKGGIHWLWKKNDMPPYEVNMSYEEFQAVGHEKNGSLDKSTQSNIFAAGKDGKLYRFNGTKFRVIQGLGVGVDGGTLNRGFHVNSAGDVWRLTTNNGWVRMSGCVAQDVGASYDGKVVYACGKNEKLYQFDFTLNKFKQIQGLGKRIAVDDNGLPWHVNSQGQVYRQDPSYGWVGVGGCVAQDIGCGGGKVYACGTNEHLYRYNPGLDVFEEIQGLGVRIAVGPDGTAWHVNSAGMVYQLVPGSGWVQVLGCVAQDIGA